MAEKSIEIEKMMTPLLKVLLIRHGETVGWLDRRLDGHTDSPLTERGEEQMREVADRLAGIPLTAVYSSDLARTRRGASMLADMTGLEVKVVPELREMNFGELENLPFKEGYRKMGGDMSRAMNWVDNRFPGGENLIDMRERVMPAYERILSQSSGTIAIYAHGGTNRLILCEELGIDLYNFFRIEQNHACVNVIDRYPMDFVVVKLVNGDVNTSRVSLQNYMDE